MRYVIVGAGAIGGTIGGRLADAGRDVVAVARGVHGEVLSRHGLTLALPDRVILVKVPVVPSIAELQLQPNDVLILAVKSHDSAGILAQLGELPVGTSTAGQVLPIFCFQNGINNEPMALRYFTNVHGVCVALPATYLEAGRVEAPGSPASGVLEVGRFPQGTDATDHRIVEDLTQSGFIAQSRTNVMAWKRAKLVQNLGNAFEPLCGPDLSEADVARVAELIGLARKEAHACFAATGLEVVSDHDRDAALSGQLNVLPVGGQHRKGGSTWQSITRGIGSVETDFLNGEIVLLGRLHGVPTPVNEEVQRRMASLAHGGQTTEIVSPLQMLAVVA